MAGGLPEEWQPVRSFGVFNAAALTAVRTFAGGLYASLGLRQDSAFDLLDSALSSPERRTLVRLSLNPAFRRRWSSTCDALADGSLQPGTLRRVFVRTLPIAEGRPALGNRRQPLASTTGGHQPRADL